MNMASGFCLTASVEEEPRNVFSRGLDVWGLPDE